MVFESSTNHTATRTTTSNNQKTFCALASSSAAFVQDSDDTGCGISIHHDEQNEEESGSTSGNKQREMTWNSHRTRVSPTPRLRETDERFAIPRVPWSYAKVLVYQCSGAPKTARTKLTVSEYAGDLKKASSHPKPYYSQVILLFCNPLVSSIQRSKDQKHYRSSMCGGKFTSTTSHHVTGPLISGSALS